MCKWLKDGEMFSGEADKRWKEMFKKVLDGTWKPTNSSAHAEDAQ